MKTYLLRVLKIWLLFLFSIVNANAQPSWVAEEVDNNGYYYGVGIGESISEARTNALVEMAQTISSRISTRTSSAVTTGTEGTQVQSSSHYSMTTSDIDLNMVNWAKTEKSGELIYVLAKLSIADFVKHYEHQLAILSAQFTGLLNKQDYQLAEFIQVQNNKQALDTAIAKAELISLHSRSATGQLKAFLGIYRKQNQFINRSCFQVKKSNNRIADKIFLPVLESVIAANQFRVKNSLECVPVNFSARFHHPKAGLAKVSLKIELGSPTIVSQVIKVQGHSDGSPMAARLDAAERVSRYFDNHGGLISKLFSHREQVIEIKG